jgi:hypothetical protein
VEHQLLGRERNERIRARITCGSGAENNGSKGSESACVGGSCPRNQILNVLALRRRQNREQKRGWWLSAIARSRDDAQRTPADPPSAALIAKHRTPAATANDLTGRTPTIGNGSCADHEQDAGAVVERVVHRDQAVRIDYYFLRELLCIERCVQRATLLVAARSGDAAIENAGKNRALLRDLRECASYELGDDVG